MVRDRRGAAVMKIAIGCFLLPQRHGGRGGKHTSALSASSTVTICAFLWTRLLLPARDHRSEELAHPENGLEPRAEPWPLDVFAERLAIRADAHVDDLEAVLAKKGDNSLTGERVRMARIESQSRQGSVNVVAEERATRSEEHTSELQSLAY